MMGVMQNITSLFCETGCTAFGSGLWYVLHVCMFCMLTCYGSVLLDAFRGATKDDHNRCSSHMQTDIMSD